jgi:tRNA G18 (ribose-2'-O)-methylase SpoU
VAAVVHSAGGEVWAADTTGVAVERWQAAEPTLLLLGSEGSGLGTSTAALTEKRVTIPLERDLESLNVAVAAALLVHSWHRAAAVR